MKLTLINLSYLLAAVFFILGMKMLNKPGTARNGNKVAAIGMLVAVVATLFIQKIITPVEMIGALMVGSLLGYVMAIRVPMTSMPEFVAAFNGFGGLASVLVAGAEVARYVFQHSGATGVEAAEMVTRFGAYDAITISITVLIGAVTFSGSFVAFGKLGGQITGNPILFPGIRVLTLLAFLGTIAATVVMTMGAPEFPAVSEPVVWSLVVITVLSLLLGVLVVIPIGGADMPVVIALLNSYSGLAGAATGFVLNNTALIVSGALVGASGIILSIVMCEGMNRSLLNVLIGGFGGEAATTSTGAALPEGMTVNEASVEDVAIMLTYAEKVIIVPGYGMAVAQAQHVVRELSDELAKRNVKVSYAIHPVAGRMPGHMNVLLAEANVSYDVLFEMDEINGEFENTDVVLVIGANDVVNPAARHDESSPIYGMPILDVDKAHQVIVLKRSMRPGYAGVENELFYNNNTSMLFGDAKASITKLVAQVKAV